MVVSGSKNAALPLLFSTLLTGERCVLRNVPALRRRPHRDRRAPPPRRARVDAEPRRARGDRRGARRSPRTEAPYELVKTMRASFLVLGPLLARFGRARVSTPGGCAIGARPGRPPPRPGSSSMGAQLRITEGYVEAEAERLSGAKIVLDFPSVGATQQLMMAAGARGGHDRDRERGARAGDRLPRPRARAMGARDRGRGHAGDHDRGPPALGGRRHRRHPRPHRGRDVHGGRRRSPAARCASPARAAITWRRSSRSSARPASACARRESGVRVERNGGLARRRRARRCRIPASRPTSRRSSWRS